MKRPVHCAAQPTGCKMLGSCNTWHVQYIAKTSHMKHHLRFQHDPSMMRPWSEHELVISHPPNCRGCLWRFGNVLYQKIAGFALRLSRQMLPRPQRVTRSDITMRALATKMWHSDITKCWACHEKWDVRGVVNDEWCVMWDVWCECCVMWVMWDVSDVSDVSDVWCEWCGEMWGMCDVSDVM